MWNLDIRIFEGFYWGMTPGLCSRSLIFWVLFFCCLKLQTWPWWASSWCKLRFTRGIFSKLLVHSLSLFEPVVTWSNSISKKRGEKTSCTPSLTEHMLKSFNTQLRRYLLRLFCGFFIISISHSSLWVPRLRITFWMTMSPSRIDSTIATVELL